MAWPVSLIQYNYMQFSVILWLTKKTKVKVQQDELIQTDFYHTAETAHRVKQKQPPDPVDTGRKLKVCEMFKRRPGRLLNVLGMFNLRPVFTMEVFYKKSCS